MISYRNDVIGNVSDLLLKLSPKISVVFLSQQNMMVSDSLDRKAIYIWKYSNSLGPKPNAYKIEMKAKVCPGISSTSHLFDAMLLKHVQRLLSSAK